jgi:hypothetical protein
MRQRAQAVQHLTPPWHAHPPEHGTDEWLVSYSTDNPLAGLVATTPDYGRDAIAEHIASWHPGVALAVADWLDQIACMVELDAEMFGRVGCDEALATARAFLGTQEGSHGD